MGRESYRASAATLRAGAMQAAPTLALIAATGLAATLAMSFGGCDRAPAAKGGAGSARSPTTSGGAATGALERESVRNAAEQYLNTGHPEEALVLARKLVAREADDPAATELLARVLLAKALLEPAHDRGAALRSAGDAYLRAAELDRSNASLQHAAGVALDQADRLEEALAHYERARALEPTNAQYAVYAAMAMRRLDRAPEALPILDAAAIAAPNESLVEVVRSDVRLATGDATGALASAQRARELSPAELPPRVAEARALRALGLNADAAERLLAMQLEWRRNEGVAQELAEALLALGRPADAARAWLESLNSDSRRWRSAVGAAEAFLATGDRIRAQSYLDQAVALAPKEPRVLEAQKRIAGMNGSVDAR